MASPKATREAPVKLDKDDVMHWLKANRMFMVPGRDWRDLARVIDLKRLYPGNDDRDVSMAMLREGLAVKSESP